MKNNFKLFGLIAIIMITAFSFLACEETEKDNTEEKDITITVKGDFSEFIDKSAAIYCI